MIDSCDLVLHLGNNTRQMSEPNMFAQVVPNCTIWYINQKPLESVQDGATRGHNTGLYTPQAVGIQVIWF